MVARREAKVKIETKHISQFQFRHTKSREVFNFKKQDERTTKKTLHNEKLMLRKALREVFPSPQRNMAKDPPTKPCATKN